MVFHLLITLLAVASKVKSKNLHIAYTLNINDYSMVNQRISVKSTPSKNESYYFVL